MIKLQSGDAADSNTTATTTGQVDVDSVVTDDSSGSLANT